jgi:hypothetical protein
MNGRPAGNSPRAARYENGPLRKRGWPFLLVTICQVTRVLPRLCDLIPPVGRCRLARLGQQVLLPLLLPLSDCRCVSVNQHVMSACRSGWKFGEVDIEERINLH